MTEAAAGCRVVLGGWYGAANLGDELILSTFVDWVRAAGGVPTVISVHPHYTTHAHGVAAADYADLAAIVEAMAAADLFVLGGGGLFQNYDAFDEPSLHRFPARNVSQFAQFFYLARELGLPTAALAQGVGPLRCADARAISADVFRLADVASVRDSESAALLREIGVVRDVPIAADPGWCLPVAPVARGALDAQFPQLAGRRVLALVVRDWPFDPGWEEPFVAVFAASLPADWGCLWLDFTRTPDASGERPVGSEIAARMVERLGPRIPHALWQGMRVDEAAGLIAAADACLAMRLHGVLLGHLAGVPVAALEYDGKVRALGDELGVPGAQRLPLAAISERLPEALRHLTGGDAEVPFRLAPEARANLARSALAHRDLLWRAMAAARRMPAATEPPVPALLAEWVGHEFAAAPRVVTSLLQRLRALRERDAGAGTRHAPPAASR